MSNENDSTLEEMAADLGMTPKQFLGNLIMRGWLMRGEDGLWRTSDWAVAQGYMHSGVVTELTPELSDELSRSYLAWIHDGGGK